jgi:hypothetical protein
MRNTRENREAFVGGRITVRQFPASFCRLTFIAPMTKIGQSRHSQEPPKTLS